MNDGKVTTPTISTLLLVPADGDPLGLLAPGKCGARAPMLCLRPGRETWSRISVFGSWDATSWRFGLVLAHEGEPVPEGFDRLHRKTGIRWAEDYAIEVLNRGQEAAAIWFNRMRSGLAEYEAGTLIALDPAGRDVTDEVMRGR